MAEMRVLESYVQNRESSDVVYFCREGDLIRIGTTGNASSRIRAHRKHALAHRQPFVVLAAVNGGRTEELAVHAYFHEERLGQENELFEPSPRLMAYIRWLRRQYFVAVGEEAAEGIPTKVMALDYMGWRPEANRQEESQAPLLGPFWFGDRVLTGDDYYTPAELIELVREALGGVIDLDPASHPVANKVVNARQFYQKTDDGLMLPWSGAVWLNPPFSAWDRWAGKLLAELRRGEITRCMAIAAAPALTTQYFQPVLRAATLMVVLARRISFTGPHVDDGNGAGAATGHVLFYFGPDAGKVLRIFNGMGTYFVPAPFTPVL